MDANDVVWLLRNGIRKKYPGYDELKDAQSISVSGRQHCQDHAQLPPSRIWHGSLTGRVGPLTAGQKAGPRIPALSAPALHRQIFEQGRKLQLKARIDHQLPRKANTNDVNFAYYSDADAALKDIRAGKLMCTSPRSR